MSTATSATVRDRVHELLSYIRTGRILDAMTEFYDEHAVMEEPAYGETAGLAANIEREKAFLSQVKEWKGFEATAVGVDEDGSSTGSGRALIENRLDFVNTAGEAVHMEQVSVQTWRDGKIVRERFYYDRGA